MDQKKLYGKWYLWDEFAGIPLTIHHWLRGNKIHKLLFKRIKKAEAKASQIVLTEKMKNEFLIEYEKLDNFFSHHFKNIEVSKHHNFDQKIGYCLEQFKKESLRLMSYSKSMILQENFVNGAEKTLFLYFALQGKVKREIRLSDIIIGEKNSNLFLDFLKAKRFIDENHNLLVDQKSSFIRIHRFLKDHHIINPDFQDTSVIEAMENEYNSNFDRGTYSRAIMVKPSDFEENTYKELSKILGIDY